MSHLERLGALPQNLILIVEQKMRIKRNRQTDRCKNCSFFVTHVQKMSFGLIRMLICCDSHKPQLIFLKKMQYFCDSHAKISHFFVNHLQRQVFPFAK